MPRLHMQVSQRVTERKACKKSTFLLSSSHNILFAKYIENLLHTANQEILILKLGELFSQTPGFVPGCQNR